jgi:hypothetical protein
MAEDQVGLRSNQPRELPLWTKLFSGFKVALDPKKLLLAAAGILVMSAGWWVLSLAYYSMSGRIPEWSDYQGKLESYAGENQQEKTENAWRGFKQDRRSWNLMYAMAAPVPNLGDIKNKGEAFYDDADEADTYEEYKDIVQAKGKIDDELHRLDKAVKIVGQANTRLEIFNGPQIPIKLPEGDAGARLEIQSKENKLTAKDLAITPGQEPKLSVAKIIVGAEPKDIEKIDHYLRDAKTVDQIRLEARENNNKAVLKALDLSVVPHLRPAGQFRTWPWFEHRGPNPYLMVTGGVKHNVPGTTIRTEPWEGLGFLPWFFGDEVPVLLEPLAKFLRPIIYLLSRAAGGWNRLYLIFIILWTLATWALFGGAITRMAAVQVARTNEKIGMTEALRFARTRIQGYFSAPLLPLVFLAILTVFLWLYGLVGIFTWFVGDIVVYGLFAPIMLLIGLIMAVVLVGLVGWPLMYSTISTEGSDSFDAISRSYSYVYQAPWHYLWYTAVALAYGAVLVFFVGLMGSLMVYLGKWGISQAPGPQNREPTYLFVYAPTSFGWRDLLLAGSPGVKTAEMAQTNGTTTLAYAPTAKYWGEMSWSNHIGAVLVSVWLYLLFLLIVGFGYSYFWSATTIIYLLMRRKVDDTELDEIHLEEEELEEPYAAPGTTTPAPPVSPVDKTAPTGPAVTMVEPPALRTPAPAVVSATAPPAPAPVPGGNQEHTGPAAGEPTTHSTEGDKP